ncbi:MAG: type II toxin-antitoxin system VapB family antitoxin [archaeon]|nr:type II toxin-antitoxin system VapB family antitoxin [archaeon]
MQTAKLFQNGRSQAVRLPKAFRLSGTEVKISREGNKIILEPIDDSWEQWFDAINQFSEDFMRNGREQPEAQQRDWGKFE